MMKKRVLLIIVGLALLIGGIAVIGATLPRDHKASRMLHVRRSPEDAWAAISQEMNASSVPVDILESDPPRRLLSRVKETEKMFGGTWTVVVAPANDGSTIAITEDGWSSQDLVETASRTLVSRLELLWA
jgi:hypothetical protein